MDSKQDMNPVDRAKNLWALSVYVDTHAIYKDSSSTVSQALRKLIAGKTENKIDPGADFSALMDWIRKRTAESRQSTAADLYRTRYFRSSILFNQTGSSVPPQGNPVEADPSTGFINSELPWTPPDIYTSVYWDIDRLRTLQVLTAHGGPLDLSGTSSAEDSALSDEVTLLVSNLRQATAALNTLGDRLDLLGRRED